MTTFTTKVTLVSSLVIGLALAVAPAQAQLGATAGYTIDMLNEPSFSGSATNTFESGGGFNAGLFYEIKLGRVGLRPGLFFQQSRFDWNLSGLEELAPQWNPLETVVRAATIPFDLLFYIPMQAVNPYVAAGPAINYLHTNQPDLRQALDYEKGSTNFWSINLGAGVEIRAPALGLRLLPEIRYSYALSGFMQEEYIVRTTPYAADGSPRFSGLTFRLGLSFLSVE